MARKMKMKMKVPGLLKNKYILYILLIIGIINVLGYIALEDYNSLGLFVSIGLLSSYFSKNMSINLLLSIVITGLMAANSKFREGMKNDDDDDKTTEKMVNGKDKCKEDNECPKGKKCNTDGKCVATFQNNVPPSSPAPVDTDESVGDRIDYAATMEQAYDNLNKMLGEGGVKNITDETKKLVSQQKDLMGTLNSMAPVLNNAKETLKGLDMGDLKGMQDIMSGLKLPGMKSKKK